MDLRNRSNQDESEEEHYAAKIPKLSHHHHALPLFPDPNSRFPSSTTTFGILGDVGLFSKTQWQELELQALIFRHLLAGVSIPPHLLHSYYLLQPTSLLHSRFWGRTALDPEPGRCRRTDGKKWRCSKDVAMGHKYCDRHLNRGRSRSRKPVEITTTADTEGTARVPFGPSMIPLHQNPRSSAHLESSERFHGAESDMTRNGRRSDGHLLCRFIDDSATCLTIGTPRSDTSLKLATGTNTSSETDAQSNALPGSSWGHGWGPGSSSMGGGPLAEALRSSVPNSPSSHIS